MFLIEKYLICIAAFFLKGVNAVTEDVPIKN